MANIILKWILSQGVDLINIPLTEGQDFATNTFDIKYDLINYHHFDLLMESYNQQNEQEIIAKVLRMENHELQWCQVPRSLIGFT